MMMKLGPLVAWLAFVAVGCTTERRATASVRPHFARTFTVDRFQRGNLHTHTLQSDGDAPPTEAIEWYKAHGYAFVAITDHNVYTGGDRYASMESSSFAVISGEEISMWVTGKQVHVNALCTRRVIGGGEFETATGALRTAVRSVRAQDGVAIVNHPNFDWALTEEDVFAVAGSAQLLEIASGHPYVHSKGDEAHTSHEALWDAALSRGFEVMGVAVDDVHHMRASADPPAFPGVAWVGVFADSPTRERICDALSRGELYASTGPVLRSVAVSDQDYLLEAVGDVDVIEFVGDGGRLLATRSHPRGAVAYRLQTDERYVRARIKAGDRTAWTPAVRVTRE